MRIGAPFRLTTPDRACGPVQNVKPKCPSVQHGVSRLERTPQHLGNPAHPERSVFMQNHDSPPPPANTVVLNSRESFQPEKRAGG